MPFPQFVSLELRQPPDGPELPQYTTIPRPSEFMPVAIRIAGRFRPTGTSTVYLLVPGRIASLLSHRGRAVGFVQVVPVGGERRETFLAASTSYDRRLHLLQISVLPEAFHQDSLGTLSATAVVGIFP